MATLSVSQFETGTTGTAGEQDTLSLSASFTRPNSITDSVEIVQVDTTTGISVNWWTTAVPPAGIQLIGNTGNDTLGASNAADTITAGAGADSVNGYQGNDNIDGGDGNDLLRGGKGNDTVSGGAGDDYLVGGQGADSIVAGAGADSILSGAGDDSIDLTGSNATLYFKSANGTDTVTGFTLNSDKISLVDYSETGKIDFSVAELNGKLLASDALQTAINAAVASQTASGDDRTLTLLSGTTVTFKGVGANLTGRDFTGFVIPARATAVTAAGTDDASAADVTYTVTPGNYTYSIAGFGTGDKIDFPADTDPTVLNTGFTDGVVDILWENAGISTTIRLTGLTATQDGGLNFIPDDFTDAFGAGTIL